MSAVTLAMGRIGGALRLLGRVPLATAGMFALLALAAPGQAVGSLVFTLDSLAFIAPFIALSVLVAASAKASGADRQIAKVFSGRQAVLIVAAALFGAFSPFCSCGVIPIIAGLLAAGVPLAPVMAFWIASPLMSPEMYILTAAVFDLPFATARGTAALAVGLAAGFATRALTGRGVFAEPLKAVRGGCGSCETSALAEGPQIVWAFWRRRDRRALFRDEARTSGWFLLKWLTLAFVIESLMLAYLPAEAVSEWLGGGRWWAIPAGVAAGVPAYLNGYAAIPTVSALMEMGMAPGAALAFMVAGGVTSIPAALAVFALVKAPVFFWYLLLGLAGSLLVGFAYQGLLAV